MSRKDNMTREEIGEHALSIAIGTIRDIMTCYQGKECPRGMPIKILMEAIQKEYRHHLDDV